MKLVIISDLAEILYIHRILISCQYLQSKIIAGFIMLSKSKTPPPVLEADSYFHPYALPLVKG
jgi:hypothetical protein